MTTTQSSPVHHALARALLDAAAEVEAAEARLKSEIITAARAGDSAKVIDIVEQWQARPPAEVLIEKTLPSSPAPR